MYALFGGPVATAARSGTGTPDAGLLRADANRRSHFVNLSLTESDGIFAGVGGLYAEHSGPLVVSEVGHRGRLFGPWIPHHGGGGASLRD